MHNGKGDIICFSLSSFHIQEQLSHHGVILRGVLERWPLRESTGFLHEQASLHEDLVEISDKEH